MTASILYASNENTTGKKPTFGLKYVTFHERACVLETKCQIFQIEIIKLIEKATISYRLFVLNEVQSVFEHKPTE